MKPVKVLESVQEDFYTGNGTAGVAASALTSQPWRAFYGVKIRNHDAANKMYVGKEGVTSSTGFRLDPGCDCEFPIADPRLIYVIRDVADVDYSFLVV